MSWRDTLFFWRGEFRVDRDGAARFAGTWVGVDAGPDGDDAYASAPPDADFASARALRFAARADPPAPTEPAPATRMSATYAFPSTGAVDDGWQLLGDDGRVAWHGDAMHDVLVDPASGVVVASGSNAFAPFISAGVLSQRYAFGPGGSTRTLTLARRYLGAKDARAGWSLERVMREATEAIANDGVKNGTGGNGGGKKRRPWASRAFDARIQSRDDALGDAEGRKRRRKA
jgi:hypothetical protein